MRIEKKNVPQTRSMKTIVLTGGGTAGHVVPCLALLPELKKHFNKIVYFGTNGIEKELAEKEGVEFKEIEAVKLIRSFSLKNFLIPVKLFSSIKKTKKLLKEVSPSVVFSKGGYVSIPVAISAKKLKIPVITHESDLSLGLANKIISRYATKTLTAFEKTASGKKNFVWTGSPIKEQIPRGNASTLTFPNEQKETILFFGGSLGAKAINSAVYMNLNELTRKFNILHITGKGKQKQISNKSYKSVEFTNSIQDYFAKANYVVCRAGANSVFELLSLEKPILLVPLPKKESRGDQIDNARYFKEKGMCEVVSQENLNNNLIKSIENLQKNARNIIKNIKNNKINSPNKKIVEIIVKNAK